MFSSRPSRGRGRAPAGTPRRPGPRLEILEGRVLPSAVVVLRWNAIALDALKNDSLLGAGARQNAPTRASRALAIVQAAVFDAVNSIDGSYSPYLIQLPTLPGPSITAAAAPGARPTLGSLSPASQ